MSLKNLLLLLAFSLLLLTVAFFSGVFFAQQLSSPIKFSSWPGPQIVKNLNPKVVTVTVLEKTQEFHQQEVSSGSGFIYRPGYVITNHHVVGESRKAQVTYADGRKEIGKVLGYDFETDIAVIKVTAPIPPAPLGNSSLLQVGEFVLTLGSPQHLDRTVTSGIVSALNRTLTTNGRTFVGLIQTDAPINLGSSGGPLINLKGEIIGVNTLLSGSQGIAFALPINQVKQVADSIIAGRKVQHAYAGLTFTDLSQPQAQKVGLKAGLGALIVHVGPGTPAAKAGLKKGDIVVVGNGRQIKDSSDIIALIRSLKVGETLRLKVKRGKNFLTKNLKLIAKPQPSSSFFHR